MATTSKQLFEQYWGIETETMWVLSIVSLASGGWMVVEATVVLLEVHLV